ncbi:MAG: TraB/VirB10 family protein [Desulfobacteria bacterium]
MFFGKPPSANQSASSNGLDSTPQNTGISAVWSNYSAKKKKKIVTIGIIALIILFALLGYRTKYGSTKASKVDQAVAARDIDINRGMIEKSLYTRTIDAVDSQRKELEKLAKEFAHLQKRSSQVRPSAPEKTLLVRTIEQNPDMKKAKANKPKPEPEKPEPKPRVNNRVSRIPPPPKPSGIPEKDRISVIGGINIVRGKELAGKPLEETSKKKVIYLPPSFVEATLLSGVSAPTTLAAKSNPLPMILRIKDLAILPNKVKANLKGCFAIAEGRGNLADERVHVRILTISCVAKDGNAVIDQAVKGFVVDEDGKVGLSGRVVAKMGVHIARTVLAGFVRGFGAALETTTSTINYNPLTGGTSQRWTSDDAKTVLTAGVGKGIAQGAEAVQDFYLQLAQQTLPVIEVGATKTVTLVISEGVGLEIKEQNTQI